MSMVQCYYEINVSRLRTTGSWVGNAQYVHFFVTTERSCVTERQMQEVAKELLTRFPWPEFHVEVTHIECHGTKVAAFLPGEGRQLPDVNSPVGEEAS